MSVAKVESHIDNIQRKLTKSLKIAEKGDSLKLTDAAKLGAKTNSIVNELKKSIKEFDGANPTPAEASAIMKKMEKIVETTEKELDALVKSKGRIDELHVGGLVKKNLVNSQEAGVAFSKLLLEKCPADLKDPASALESRRMTAFDKAVAVFANSTGGEDQAEVADDSD